MGPCVVALVPLVWLARTRKGDKGVEVKFLEWNEGSGWDFVSNCPKSVNCLFDPATTSPSLTG